jgi:hypothetical protein
MQFARGGQAFDSDDAFTGDARYLSDARLHGLPLDQNGTSGALPFAAAELGSGEIEVVAQDAEQRTIAIGVETPAGSVNIEFRDTGHFYIVAPNCLLD